MMIANPVTLPLSGYTAQNVRLSVEGAVATITLNRPERKNPLTFESYAELGNIFRAAARDKSVKAVVITGDFSRASRKYAPPGWPASAVVAFSASIASHGTTTVIFGSTRIRAISSSIWWVAPSGPTDTPACEPTILTLVWLRQTVVRICSQLRPGEKAA